MRTLAPNEYVLVRKPDGSHYEEFCTKGDPTVWDILNRGETGRLAGHAPKPGHAYKAVPYHNRKSNRVCFKLAHRKYTERR